MKLWRSSKEQLRLRAVAIVLLVSLATSLFHAIDAKKEKEHNKKSDHKSADNKAVGPNIIPLDNLPNPIPLDNLADSVPISSSPPQLPPGPILLPRDTPAFDVTKFGAKGDGKPNLDEDSGDCLNALAFIQAWRQACDHPVGAAKVEIPPGTYVVAQVLFTGPCKSAPIMVENKGTLMANTDLSLYPSAEWILFERVENAIFTGTGVVNAQGSQNWNNNDCKHNSNCAPLPTSIKIYRSNNTIIDGVTSLDSMFFHVFLSACHNVTIRGAKLFAPDLSPNTDGVHTSRARDVIIYDSVIGTGDDCISIGEGSFNIGVFNVKCGPGHGISVGSLGKEEEEEDVRGVHVQNCTFTRTQNGARIKTWPGKVDTVAEQIVYEDLIMDYVKNPIIIDATYSTHSTTKEPSHVKLADIEFKNIRGTAANNKLVSLNCSQAVPCGRVILQDIQLTTPPQNTPVTSCLNADVKMVGINQGIVCQT